MAFSTLTAPLNLNTMINPIERFQARFPISGINKEMTEFLLAEIAAVKEEERRGIAEAMERLISHAGNETEIAVNDLLNYAELLKKPLQ